MNQNLKFATFGGGCFWCTETIFRRVIGVSNVMSGYAGAGMNIPKPSYKQVCTGQTAFAEVIQFQYDPQIIQYSDLLRIFFNVHDPTTLNRQGNDSGPQYRSIILYRDQQELNAAQNIIQEIQQEQIYGKNKIVTELKPFDVFYEAEDYHQDYYNLNPQQGYCQAVISPKVKKFLTKFKNFTQ